MLIPITTLLIMIINWLLSNIKMHSDIDMTIYDYLKKYNYPIENHWITTEDGYVLLLHRVPGGQNETLYDTKSKPAVLLMHGLGSSSVNWIFRGPKDSLGLALADAGYDVWLGNTRGNTWSRNHLQKNPDIDVSFWDFSFERSGRFDVAANIDYILKTTGQQKLFYIGHSQGTSQFFALASLRPEYNDKIALMTALAPVAYMTHMSSLPLRLLSDNLDFLQQIAEENDIREIRQHPLVTILISILCEDGSPLEEVCAGVVYLISGFDPHRMDKSVLPIFLTHTGVGMSINMLIHYAQEISSGKFGQYDYGREQNKKKYGSPYPPNFDLSLITAPIALYYGENDFLAAVKDVQQLESELPNVNKSRKIDDRRWNHLDFTLAKGVYDIINKDVIAHQQMFIDAGALIPDSTPATSTTEATKGSSERVVTQSIYTLFVVVLVILYY